MHVLQFGFGGGRSNPHRLENHETLGVVCTGTHDTDTALGWWRAHDAQGQRHLGLDPNEPHWSLIGRALASRCRLALLPLQDVLGLGSEARMNRPGTTSGNWCWRMQPGALTGELAARLRAATKAAKR
jgi:4-alpha-glucanotransferase